MESSEAIFPLSGTGYLCDREGGGIGGKDGGAVRVVWHGDGVCV